MNRLRASIVVALWLAVPAWACAHAAPTVYDPPPGAALQAAPVGVTLRFSERLEPAVSMLRITGPSGAPAGSGTVDAGTPDTMSAVLRSGEAGTYTVAWQSVSADDGDIAQGSYGFSVQSPYAGDVRSRVNHGVDIPEAVASWAELAGDSLVLGALLMWLLVVRPMAGALRDASRAEFRLRLCVMTGGIVGAAGATALIALTASGLAAWSGGGPAGLDAALQTTTARFASAHAILSAGLAWAAVTGRIVPMRRTMAFLALAALLALFRARVSHAAASPLWPEFSVAVNAVHLLGKEAWIGGLLAFCMALLPILRHETAAAFAHALCGLSRLCAAALAVGGLAGCYLVWLHLKSWDNLLSTHWGLGLVTLLLFSFLLVSLRLYHQRRLDAAAARATRAAPSPADAETLGLACYSLWTEGLVGLAILFVSAGMINTMPPLGGGARHLDGFAMACIFAAACVFVLSGVLRSMSDATAGGIRDGNLPCPAFESQVLWFVFIVDIVLLAMLGYHGAMHTSGGFAERCVLDGGSWEESVPAKNGTVLSAEPRLGCTTGSGGTLSHITDVREYLRRTTSSGATQ